MEFFNEGAMQCTQRERETLHYSSRMVNQCTWRCSLQLVHYDLFRKVNKSRNAWSFKSSVTLRYAVSTLSLIGLLGSDNEGSTFLPNVSNCLPVETACTHQKNRFFISIAVRAANPHSLNDCCFVVQKIAGHSVARSENVTSCGLFILIQLLQECQVWIGSANDLKT